MDKKTLRKIIREEKKKYSLDVKRDMSAPIWNDLESDDVFLNARKILLYWSMDDEVYTHDFVTKWYKEKEIYLPCVVGDDLEVRRFTGLDSMRIGDYDILEPVGELLTNVEVLDLIIVPGVAFDKNNNRMGRGKGYYDKLLKTTKAKTIGVCFGFQFYDEIPTDELDVPMYKVIH